MRTVLLIAYHFPPVSGSSGLQRTLRFAQYLPDYGWRPIVLSVRPSAYESVDERSLELVPRECEVVRTPCLDAGRHLSWFGRYPRFAALPDRWASWQFWAVRAARRLVAERGIKAIWSTYPIATAHKIAASVSARTGLPWIADFRDPMAQDGYPEDPRRWRSFKRIEEQAVRQASKLVFVSPSALDMYLARYPQSPKERFVMLENGYDEDSFSGLERGTAAVRQATPILLHSGIVYPSERDPAALFEALGRLRARGAIAPGDFFLRFRAAVHEGLLRDLAARHGVESMVDIQPAIPYRQALQEMLEVDALVVMQGENCNGQTPAKLYEYLRAGRPILGLADPAGDTGVAIRNLGFPVAKLESVEALEQIIPEFLARLRGGSLPALDRAAIARYSRRALTGRLAALLDEVSRSER